MTALATILKALIRGVTTRAQINFQKVYFDTLAVQHTEVRFAGFFSGGSTGKETGKMHLYAVLENYGIYAFLVCSTMYMPGRHGITKESMVTPRLTIEQSWQRSVPASLYAQRRRK